MSQAFADALQGAPPDAGPPDGGGGGGGGAGDGPDNQNSMDALDAAEQALHEFIQLDHDEPDRQAAARALQIVLQIKASNQKSAQSGDLKSFTRALAGAPGLPGLR